MIQSTSDNSPIPEGFRRCTRGDQCAHPNGPMLPATKEFFTPRKSRKSPFTSWCKACLAADQTTRRNRDRDAHNASRREYYSTHKEGVNASNARYRHKDMGKQRLRTRDWRMKNPDKSRRSGMLWQTKYPEKKLAINRINDSNRRARIEALPHNFTLGDWQKCLEYFDYCCAACGRPLTDSKMSHADHWIPLAASNCPGTISTNIIPLCGGNDGCNNSKHMKQPLDWLVDKFGEDVARLKLAAIEAYFEWVSSQSKK